MNFEKHSLILVKDGKIIHSSGKSGLRPLVECIQKFKGKVDDCVLCDKVVGLAAARLIVYSHMVSMVITETASEYAVDLIKKNNMGIKAKNVVENILNKEKSSVCPMEKKALETEDNEQFFKNFK